MRTLTRMPVLLLLALAFAAPACAKQLPGHLDPAFGKRGKVVKAVDLEPQPYGETKVAMTRPAHGPIVVVAGKTVLAFHADGRVDRSFVGGRFEVFPPALGTVRLTAVAAMPDGGVVVGGTFGPLPISRSEQFDEKVFLARYRRDGTIDPSFGRDGVLLTDFDFPLPVDRFSPSTPPLGGARVTLEGLAADSSGRIVLDGSRLVARGPCRGGSAGFREAFAIRLRDNGELDPGFGEGGVTTLPEAEAVGKPLLTQAGGTYIPGLANRSCFPPKPRLLIRLGENGQRVSSFASDGVLQLSEEEFGWPLQIARDRHGQVVLASTSSAIYRLLPNGSPDPTFGNQGQTGFVYGDLGAVAVDRAGRTLLAGMASSIRGPTSIFFLSRLTREGHLDRSFGPGSEVLTRFGRHSQAKATAIRFASDGDILVAGTLTRPSLPGGEGIALARYLAGR